MSEFGIGIIYDGRQELDWAVRAFRKEFDRRGIGLYLFDVNEIGEDCYIPPKMDELIRDGCSTWMNRIYPSNSDSEHIRKVLAVTQELEERGCTTINPLTACIADYDKFFAYRLMKAAGVPVPETERIEDKNWEAYLERFSLPCIIKRNTGGKGEGVFKVDTPEDFKDRFYNVLESGEEYLVQSFLYPALPHDIRICVIDEKVLITHGRMLVGDEKEPWMGSCSHGSKVVEYDATGEERRMAVEASKAISAVFNVVDIQKTSEGPFVIEANPTPAYNSYGAGEEKWMELIIDHIADMARANPNKNESSTDKFIA